MNQLKKIFLSSFFYLLLFSLILLTLIWQNSFSFLPFKMLPSEQLILKIGLTGLIIIIWSNYLIIKTILNYKHNPKPIKKLQLNEEDTLEQTLWMDLQQDYEQTQKHASKSLPWLILMGPPGSGKTSLLAKLPFPVQSPQQKALTQVNNTHWVDWWLSDKAVFIDPAGKYALAPNDSPKEQLVWKTLILTLKKNRNKTHLKGILLIIDVGTLSNTNASSFNDFIENLIYQLQTLKSIKQPLMLNLLISHSDRILGFNEFFNDLNFEDRKQPLGFHLVPNNLPSQIETKFEELIKSLSLRSIWRLHHEHSLHKRGRIQEFPAQIEKLGQRIKVISTQLPWTKNLQLGGIYFISTSQHQPPLDFLQTLPASKAFGLQKHLQPLIHPENHPFFLEHLIENILRQAANRLQQSTTVTRSQITAYLLGSIAIASLTLLWHTSYLKNLRILNTVTSALQTKPDSLNSLQLPWLAELNKLNTTHDKINLQNTKIDHITGLNQTKKLSDLVENRYQDLLKTKFLPFLIDNMTSVIEENKNNNEVAVYNALSVYFMITKKHPRNVELINEWFNQNWQQQFKNNPSIKQSLLLHLNKFLNLNSSSPINEVLVDQTQKELQELPLENQIFLKLQSMYSLIPQPILNDLPSIDGIDLSKATVCSFCTTTHFQDIYNDIIPEIVNDFNQGNWVLGIQPEKPLSPEIKKSLVTKLRLLYLDYYKQQWAAALPNIQIIPAQTLSQAKRNIDLFRDSSSKFWQLLHLVYENITLNQFQVDNKKNDPLVEGLKIFFDSYSEPAQQIRYNLDLLDEYLNQINQLTEIDKGSYLAAVKRFKNGGLDDPITNLLTQKEQAPILVQPWLEAIAKGAWQAILENSRQYLNTIWYTSVLPEYKQNIQERYPIFSRSQENISYINFSHFFGPKGTVGNFFNHYLQSFVSMDQNYWTFKKLNDLSIPMSQSVLDMMMRASMIQQMFFADNYDQPLFNFSLIPLELGSKTDGFSLNVGTQTITFTPEERKDQSFYWPKNKNALFTTIVFKGENGETPSQTIDGPWAFLRLLDQSSVKSTKNAREYQVKFEIPPFSAQYLMVSEHLINPFIPGVLKKFRCPKQL